MLAQTGYLSRLGTNFRPLPETPELHPAFRKLVTANPEMLKLFHVAEKVADTNSTVLILGESGTGKELIARAVHELSARPGHFVPVNCGAIPDSLLESELFGHEKGAFTGAISSRPGRFVLADKGTIFLDEIGEMSPHLQVKLLRVLQDKVVESVGGISPRPVNVRIIAATNVNLRDLVRQGKFREDLYYRLQVVPIELPPLRSRGGDIGLLVEYFSKVCARENSTVPLTFSSDAIAALERYSWPGNIRELENLIRRLSILVDKGVVTIDDLPSQILDGHSHTDPRLYHRTLPHDGIDFNQAVDSLENSLILQALERTNGNKKAAAKLLRLNRTTLVEKIKKKGLVVPEGKESGSRDPDTEEDSV